MKKVSLEYLEYAGGPHLHSDAPEAAWQWLPEDKFDDFVSLNFDSDFSAGLSPSESLYYKMSKRVDGLRISFVLRSTLTN